MQMKTKKLEDDHMSNRKNIGLWVAQIALAIVFAMAGFMKATMPIAELTDMMGWPAQFPVLLVRFIGVAELAGAMGLILPMVTRIMRHLTPLAALGLAVIMALAMGLHIYRSEFEVLPVNLALLGLAMFVFLGRKTSTGSKAIAS